MAVGITNHFFIALAAGIAGVIFLHNAAFFRGGIRFAEVPSTAIPAKYNTAENGGVLEGGEALGLLNLTAFHDGLHFLKCFVRDERFVLSGINIPFPGDKTGIKDCFQHRFNAGVGDAAKTRSGRKFLFHGKIDGMNRKTVQKQLIRPADDCGFIFVDAEQTVLVVVADRGITCLLYTSPSPRD